MAFDAEELKHMAASVTSNYLNKGASLNNSIADLSVQHKLNQDQISRLVETANKVTYLKIMENAQDRTSTFPLASTQGVNEIILAPEAAVSNAIQKVASNVRNPLSIVAGINASPMVKSASEKQAEFDAKDSLTTEYLEQNLHKIASTFRLKFEEIEARKENLMYDLQKAAAEVRKDGDAFSKIMAKSSAPQELLKVAQVEETTSSLSRPFYDKELLAVKHLDELWKEAKEVVEAEEKLDNDLQKLAFYGASFLRAARPAAGSAAKGDQKKKPLIGGFVGWLGKNKSFTQKVVGTAAAADVVGQASLIDKNPSVWQSLRG